MSKFIFIDEENNMLMIDGNRELFQKEYVKLQNEYVNGEIEFSDFYDVLQDRVEQDGIIIDRNPIVVYHNVLDFNQN